MTHAIHAFYKNQPIFVACRFFTSEIFYPFVTSSPVCLGMPVYYIHTLYLISDQKPMHEVAVEGINNGSHVIP